MTNSIMIEKLKTEVASNPVSAAVFHFLAQRERTRDSILTGNLYKEMCKAGFKYPKSEYAKTLRFLSTIGVGTLKVSTRGNVIGLYDIKLTLQSLGRAAIEGSPSLNPFHGRKKFTVLRPVVLPPAAPRVVDDVVKDISIDIVVHINEKVLQIQVPENFKKEDISLLIEKFR